MVIIEVLSIGIPFLLAFAGAVWGASRWKSGVDIKVESIDTSLKDLIAENTRQHTAAMDNINNRFDKVDERFEKVDERFGKIDTTLDRVDTRIDGIDVRLARLEGPER